MASFLENAYSLVHQDNSADQPSQQELKTQLEKGTDETKQDTLRRIITIMLNGDPMPGLLMHIIRFVMPSKNKALKKLLYFYYEICPKLDANGRLKQEMILVWYVRPSDLNVSQFFRLHGLVTVFETIYNILMSTYGEIHSVSSASSGSLSSLNPSSHPLALAWNTAMPTYERTQYGRFLRSTNTRNP